MGTFTFPYCLPNELMEELGAFSGVHWRSLEIEPLVCDAIRAYMKPRPAAQPQQGAAGDAGYQWKQVFLPEGTRLRASFGREPYFAVVQGSEIRCGEQSLSPSAFANLRGSGNRNAWKAVWLRFPGNDQWVLADTCRAQQKAVIARLFCAGEAQPATAPAAPAKPPARASAGGPGKPGKRRRGGKGRKHGKRHKQQGRHAAAPRPAS